MFRPVGVAIVAVLALLGIAAAQTYGAYGASGLTPLYCGPTNTNVNDIGQCIAGTIPYAVIGLLLSFQLVAFSYLLGEVLNLQSFKGWYRNELWEAVKSLGIVLLVYASILIIGNVISIYSTGTPQTSPTSSLGALYSNVYTNYLLPQVQFANLSYNNLLGISMGIEWLKGMNFQTYWDFPIPPVPVPPEDPQVLFSINLGTDMRPFVSKVIESDPTTSATLLKQVLALLVFPMILALSAQAFLFYVLIAVALGVFLPLGIILRAIPFLRQIGGTLIGVAIGIAIVYPVILAVLNINVTSFFSQFYNYASASTTVFQLPTFLQYILEAMSVIAPVNPPLTIVGMPFSYTDGAVSSIAAMTGGNLAPILNSMFAYLAPLSIQMVLFITDLVIWIVATQQLAKLFGGTLRLQIGKFGLG